MSVDSTANQAHADARDVLLQADQLASTLQSTASDIERRRSLDRDTFASLKAAGMLKIFKPRRYGGYEMNWGVQIQAGRSIARRCPSTAWIVSVVGSHAAYLGRMPLQAQNDVWASGDDVLVSTGSVPRNPSATQTDDGYRVSGQWCFCSGVDHAAWAMVPASVDGTVESMRFCLLPREDFTIKDDWHVAGMSGTGSKSILLDNVAIPRHRAILLKDFFAPRPETKSVNAGSVFRADFHMFAGSAMLGPIVGAAEGACREMLKLCEEHPEEMDIQNTSVQLRIAESSAEIETAVYLLERILETQNYYADRNLTARMDDRIAMLRDRTYATRLCVRAVERLVNNLPAGSILDDQPIQRQYRDLTAMAQQIGVNWDRNMSSCGQKLLGLPTGDAFLNVE